MPEPRNAWVRILRLSNGPTTIADVLMGMAVASGGYAQVDVALLLIVASLSFYHGGMVLNDVMDIAQDRVERPNRPIPSGQIALGKARRLAIVLLTAGGIASGLAAWRLASWLPSLVGALLGAGVLLYNSPLKRSPWGPWLMGMCRGLNGMLGMSVAAETAPVVAIVPGVLFYVAGLTWFARDEAAASRRGRLLFGAMFSLLGIVWLAAAPSWFSGQGGSLFVREPHVWWLLWGVVMLAVGRRYVAAILAPHPQAVQRAVVGAIQGLVLIDASLAFGYGTPFAGLTVLLMLPLAMLLSLFIPAT